MSNIKYDAEKVLSIIVEYFHKAEKGVFISLPFEKVYSEIVQYASEFYKEVKMPSFSQTRKLIISELREMGQFNEGDRLSSAIAYKLCDFYYDDENIENVLLNEYSVSLYCNNPIICTIKLPPVEVLDMLAESISNEKKKSHTWGRINVIYHLCNKIKKKNSDLIYAVIPQFNRMVYINPKGKIYKEVSDINPICDSLCMFVKNSNEGRAFVKKISAISDSNLC